MSATWQTIRAEVAKRAQEFLSGTASGGSTTTLVDANKLNYADGYWDETVVLATSGTNADQERRVQTYTGNTLTLYSAFTAAVASGDSYELYRRFPPGSDILTAVNRAISVAGNDFRERVIAVVTATQDTLQYGCPTAPDADAMDLVALEYQEFTDAARSTWPYRRVDPSLYEIREDYDTTGNVTVKTLQLRFNPETNRLLRFVYEGPLGTLTGVSGERVRLDAPALEWLYTQSAAELWHIEAARTTDASRESALKEAARQQQRAGELRRRLKQGKDRRPLRHTVFEVSF